MTLDMWITVGVIAATFGAIATGRVRSELAALGACCALVLAGVLRTWDLFPAFGSDAVVTVAAMFVLSAALERTGLIDSTTRLLQRLPIRNEYILLGLVLPPVLAVSAFVNNTPVVIVFLPIIVSIARRNGLASSKLLMPLSFASILGGTATLIGTSTNLVVSTAGVHAGHDPIQMFELTPIAAFLAVAGLIYLIVLGPRFLPRRETVSSILEGGLERHFLTEVFVPEGSALIGRKAGEALRHIQARGRIVDVVRGGRAVEGAAADLVLEPGDRLHINVDAATVTTLKHRRTLKLHTSESMDLAIGRSAETHLIECVVSPRSEYVGKTLRQLDLAQRSGLIVLALHRSGENLRSALNETPLESGDVLLIEATDDELAALRQRGELMLLAGAQRLPRRDKRWIALLLISAVVTLSAMQLVPVTVAALAAAIIAVGVGCITSEEAYRSIDWATLLLIAGSLAMGTALEKTHTAELAAQFLVTQVSTWGPWASISIVVVIASILTNFLSNNAVAALLAPIALQVAAVTDSSPRAFLIAVAIGSSACFATPIGYQTNALVFNAGGYRFGDFVRFGLPLNVVYCVLACILIPIFWPL